MSPETRKNEKHRGITLKDNVTSNFAGSRVDEKIKSGRRGNRTRGAWV